MLETLAERQNEFNNLKLTVESDREIKFRFELSEAQS